MLYEHKQIKAAVEKLGTAVRAEGADRYERLAHVFALHAKTEEAILYPDAMPRIVLGPHLRSKISENILDHVFLLLGTRLLQHHFVFPSHKELVGRAQAARVSDMKGRARSSGAYPIISGASDAAA